MGFELVMNLKDFNKERIKITRDKQIKVGVNKDIKQAITDESCEGESHAETINRVIKTKNQMTDLLLVMVQNLEQTPGKMTDLLSTIPNNLKNLFEAVLNEQKHKKDGQNKK
jgi:hypothetical protein